ncbi:MAG: hypothetical protein LQ341_003899 [Variospora aurantia]|nr:MAG: hypothetical protein LQ341_003899 [Variospora aurantia]
MYPQVVPSNAHVALRLPSGATAVHDIKPNTTISIGKYGSFQTNFLIGRPYHYTYEILDQVDSVTGSGLRIIPPSELYADIKDDESAIPAELEEEKPSSVKDGVQYEVVDQEGKVLVRTNRNIIDDARSQSMTMEEIELLKAKGKGSGRDLVAKILDSHSALDQKTAFALAKYTLRKSKKYLRQFTVLPMDVPLLVNWMLNDRDATKIMEIREETLALVGSWSNVHFIPTTEGDENKKLDSYGHGRWIIVDETGGILVASAAEKLGVLHAATNCHHTQQPTIHVEHQTELPDNSQPHPQHEGQQTQKPSSRRKFISAQSNTITLIHANSQPNLSLLRYFNFDAANPAPSHPLSRHLRTVSWLQLLHPDEDNACTEPEIVSPEALQSWKSGKRGNYHRKRRRWERTKSIVSETRAGGFDGLMVASFMNASTILHHLVPLLRGAAQVVVYSPSVEPLVELADYYSTARRVAYLNDAPASEMMPTEDFPVDPTLLLAPTVETIRCRPWQTLPGRTHPIMTGRGGAEGYVFHATRVLPAEGGVHARGVAKRRRTGAGDKGSEQEESKREEMMGAVHDVMQS